MLKINRELLFQRTFMYAAKSVFLQKIERKLYVTANEKQNKIVVDFPHSPCKRNSDFLPHTDIQKNDISTFDFVGGKVAWVNNACNFKRRIPNAIEFCKNFMQIINELRIMSTDQNSNHKKAFLLVDENTGEKQRSFVRKYIYFMNCNIFQ